MKSQCKMCERTFGMLTKEGLCVYCHYQNYDEWPREFTDENAPKKS